MGMYEVEVEGRYTLVLEVEADGYSEAEEKAIQEFEYSVDVVANQGGEGWDHTGIIGSREVEDEDEVD